MDRTRLLRRGEANAAPAAADEEERYEVDHIWRVPISGLDSGIGTDQGYCPPPPSSLSSLSSLSLSLSDA